MHVPGPSSAFRNAGSLASRFRCQRVPLPECSTASVFRCLRTRVLATMSRVPRPHFHFLENGDALTFEVVVYCRGYIAPPPDGYRTGESWRRGETFTAVAEVQREEYVAVLTPQGSYVNVWTLHNRSGNASGVNFAVPRCRSVNVGGSGSGP